ncbi:hypothetical protein I7I48_05388 [Histoplasma ohiense]|nr:hypothetical protein I7I48_05388 [Histoplasma ohiense (nom. inval.)]
MLYRSLVALFEYGLLIHVGSHSDYCLTRKEKFCSHRSMRRACLLLSYKKNAHDNHHPNQKKYSIKVEHTVQRSTVASLQGAPVKSSSFEIMPTASTPVLQLLKRGDSYFVSAGTGKLLPASLSDLMRSWAGVAMAFEAGYIRDVMRYIRLYPFSNGHLHISGEKTTFPCTVTLSFSESHTHSITIPSEALNTWPGRILRWENKRQSFGGECTYDWRVGSAVTMSFVIGLWTDLWRYIHECCDWCRRCI